MNLDPKIFLHLGMQV